MSVKPARRPWQLEQTIKPAEAGRSINLFFFLWTGADKFLQHAFACMHWGLDPSNALVGSIITGPVALFQESVQIQKGCERWDTSPISIRPNASADFDCPSSMAWWFSTCVRLPKRRVDWISASARPALVTSSNKCLTTKNKKLVELD